MQTNFFFSLFQSWMQNYFSFIPRTVTFSSAAFWRSQFCLFLNVKYFNSKQNLFSANVILFEKQIFPFPFNSIALEKEQTFFSFPSKPQNKQTSFFVCNHKSKVYFFRSSSSNSAWILTRPLWLVGLLFSITSLAQFKLFFILQSLKKPQIQVTLWPGKRIRVAVD